MSAQQKPTSIMLTLTPNIIRRPLQRLDGQYGRVSLHDSSWEAGSKMAAVTSRRERGSRAPGGSCARWSQVGGARRFGVSERGQSCPPTVAGIGHPRGTH